jgi:hypothetical protein
VRELLHHGASDALRPAGHRNGATAEVDLHAVPPTVLDRL